ncbi:bifunctional diguanylate cyclase/phosphodiesterase [Patulibacter sp.]|uniref:putative bifunctional diguanylate cyclase/phosphodiesterase n=1 Tax=Patulibacter sp. TaxID=1912859 RepID=UPI00271E9B37|nr:bifunctional diguanylate cyclase/phosphodiesterase [Patulibacter sp.]MDO9410253.1 bifunctional diguanylate cyclase/phosphodiesterase [Patulibacter sp.]
MSVPAERRAWSPQDLAPRGAVVLALAVVAVLAVVAAFSTIGGTDGPSGLMEDRLLRLSEALLAAVLVAGVARRRAGAQTSRERTAWLVIGGLAAAVCATLAVFVVDPSLGGRLYGPFPTNVLQMAIAPLAVGALLLLEGPVRNRTQALRVVMDGAAIAASTCVLGWYVAVRPLRDAGLGADLTATSAMAYVVLDAVAFALGLLVLSRSTFPVRRTVALAVAGLALLLFADVVRIVHYLPGPRSSSALSELGWIAALTCLAVAAWLPRRRLRLDRDDVQEGWPWWLTMPYTFLIPVAVVLVLAARRGDADEPMVMGAAAIIIVLGFRHVFALRENEELTARLRRSVGELAHRAEHDELTGLLNRSGLVDRLDRLREESGAGEGQPLALVFIDVDRFKGINDTLGHAAGDAVLRRIGGRLQTTAGRADGLAVRFAGDEFVLLFPGMGSETAALRAAQDALDDLERPIELPDGGEVVVTASAGVALCPRVLDGETIVREADLAMFEAKSGGRARVQLFEDDLRARSEERMRTEQEMRRALQDCGSSFEVHLQPLALLTGDRLWGAEALVRWRHPERGMLLPGRFLPVAEESGMIIPLGEHILAEACAAAVAVPGLIVSVNLSPRQIHDPMLVATVRQQLELQGLPAGRLCLEVTEDVLVDDRTIEVLEDLRALGVRVAIDDFGIGASSLRQLRRIPGAVVKIDRSFTERLDGPQGGDDRVLITALVAIAEQLDLEVVAEGIERQAQLEIVRDLGVTIGQGWHLGMPQRSGAFVTERGGRPFVRRTTAVRPR